MSRMMMTAAAMSLLALPAVAAVINVGSGKKDFIANQELAYPHTQLVQTQTTTTNFSVEPAAGAATPEDNSMKPMNSRAKPHMSDAPADPNPLPANN